MLLQTLPSPTRPTKPYKGIPMEGIVATWYTKIRANDDELMPLVNRLSALLPAGSRILEVAPGPGTLSIELAKLNKYNITGVDISKTFVEIETKNAQAAGVSVTFRHGNASELPFPAASFDFIVCRAAFKNFTEPERAIQEMYRVLKTGGQALLNDLMKGSDPQTIDTYVNHMGLNALNTLITKWTFHNFLLKNAYTQSQMRTMVASTDFKTCTIESDAISMHVWLTKPAVRAATA